VRRLRLDRNRKVLNVIKTIDELREDLMFVDMDLEQINETIEHHQTEVGRALVERVQLWVERDRLRRELIAAGGEAS
jgi:L-lysine 2,3-aminomutase